MTVTVRNSREDLVEALTGEVAERGLVFVANPLLGDSWEMVSAELAEAFFLSQQAAREKLPILYVVDGADLLGRGGAGPAMVACGLLSAARTAALELAGGATVNVLALDESPETGAVFAWISHLLAPGAPRGEVIRLGTSHLGKALP
jgi:hypothetical protein